MQHRHRCETDHRKVRSKRNRESHDEGMQRRRVKGTLKRIDDKARRDDEHKNIHDALYRRLLQKTQLPAHCTHRHERKQHAHLRRYKEEILHWRILYQIYGAAHIRYRQSTMHFLSPQCGKIW